ncbi:MAG: putative molybdenum carrier protein, partial [Mariprofundaceae bacterium]|nr:putative molybdenum carrier protein [Mariprofundaceae bacterium]
MSDSGIYMIEPSSLRKVVSGGQTGVDRAALDAAMVLGVEVGGWCPRGRRALDGEIAAKYPLSETRGRSYQTRTKWNVRDSDATLILCRDEPSGGTALTIKYCEQLGKPFY